MYILLILQYTAHLLADFIFQPQKWCDQKDSKTISGVHFYHALIVFVCSWALSWNLSFWWAALLISAFHFGLDVAKSFLTQRDIKGYLFFIDQTLHIGIITGIVCFFSKNTLVLFPCFLSINTVFILFALIACTKPSNIFIKKFLETNDIISATKPNSLLNAGRIIGSLERILSFGLILSHEFAAVGFIIAAKSILRFKDTDTKKTEYLLIGSFLSFGIAILLGMIYLNINKIIY